MSWLKKLLHRETHDEWLTRHPGKESTSRPPTVNSEEEQQATRRRMEDEMDTQRTGRDPK